MTKINGVEQIERDPCPGFAAVNGPAFRAACDARLRKSGIANEGKKHSWALFGGCGNNRAAKRRRGAEVKKVTEVAKVT